MQLGDIIGAIRMRDEASGVLRKNAEALSDLQRGAQGAVGGLDILKGGFLSTIGTVAKFSAAYAVVNTVMGAMSGGANAVIGLNAQLETAELGFEKLMGSATAAKDHVADLFEFAKKTPYETADIVAASRMLQTFGGSALNTKENLELFGDSAAVTGSSLQNLSFWVGRAYSMVQGGQKFGEAAMRLQELAILTPEARQEMERLQKAGASATEVWDVFTKSLEKNKGAMEDQAKTWGGLMSTLSDAVNLLFAETFRPVFAFGKDLLALFITVFDSGPVTKFSAFVSGVLNAALDTTRAVARELKPAFDAVYSAVEVLFSKLSGPDVAGFGELLQDVIVYAAHKAAEAIIAMSAGIEKLAPYIQTAIDWITQLATTIYDRWLVSMDRVVLAIASVLQASERAWPLVEKAIIAVWGAFDDLVNLRVDAYFTGVYDRVSAITQAFAGLMDILIPIVDLWWEALGPMMSPVWGTFVNILDSIVAVASTFIEQLRGVGMMLGVVGRDMQDGGKGMDSLRASTKSFGEVLGMLLKPLEWVSKKIADMNWAINKFVTDMNSSVFGRFVMSKALEDTATAARAYGDELERLTESERQAQSTMFKNVNSLIAMARGGDVASKGMKDLVRETDRLAKSAKLTAEQQSEYAFAMREVQAAIDKKVMSEKQSQAEQQKAAAAAEKAGNEYKKLRDSIMGVTEAQKLRLQLSILEAAGKGDLNATEAERYRRATDDSVRSLMALGKAVSQKAFVDFTSQLDHQRESMNLIGNVQQSSQLQVWIGKFAKVAAIGEQNANALRELATEFEVAMAPESLRPIIAEIRKLDEQINELDKTPNNPYTAELRHVVTELSRVRIEGLVADTEIFRDQIASLAIMFPQLLPFLYEWLDRNADQFEEVTKYTYDWTDSLSELSQAFANLSEIGGGAMGGLMQRLGEVVSLMVIGTKAGESFFNVIAKRDKDGKIISGKFDFGAITGAKGASAAANAYATLAVSAMQAYGAMQKATDVAGRGNRAMGGAAVGYSIGNKIVPVVGGWVGAAVGAIWGAARNPAWEDVMKRVGSHWGTNISEGLAREIATLSKSVGGRDVAEALSFDKILGEAGGLSASNVEKFTARFRDLFSFEEQGKISAEQLRTTFETNIGAFIQYVESQNEIASRSFTELIDLAQRFGVESAALDQFVSRTTQALGGSIGGLIAPVWEQFANASEAVDEAREALAEYTAERDKILAQGEDRIGAGDRESLRELADAMAEAQGVIDKFQPELDKLATGSQAEFERLGTIILAAVNAGTGGGQSPFQAIVDQLPNIGALREMYEGLGLSIEGTGFASLDAYAKIVQGNESLFTSVGALNETAILLSRINGLNAESFAALQQQGVATYDKLIAAGLTEKQALEEMAGWVGVVIDGHSKGIGPIDEQTKALIAQAQKYDVLKGKAKDMATILEDGFGRVVDALDRVAKGLGVDIPDAMSKIPRNVSIDVGYNYPGIPTVPADLPFGGQPAAPEQPVHMHIYQDGRQTAEVVAPHLAEHMAFEVV